MGNPLRTKKIRILGFAWADAAPALCAALSAVPGPIVSAVCDGDLAALVQADEGQDRSILQSRIGRGRPKALRALMSVQQRLEVACQQGAFLPADPGHNRCCAMQLLGLLADAAAPIRAALAGAGTCHQWDVILRWHPEPVVAARRSEIEAEAAGAGPMQLAAAVDAALRRERSMREAALLGALGKVTLAAQPTGAGTTETGVTVLVPARGEAVLEEVLCGLPPQVATGASADLRGPLPPISFAAVRVETAAPGEVAKAWHMLCLADRVDAAGLRRQWHACAARLHPDHGATDDGPVTEAGAAFRLLRGLLPAQAAQSAEQAWSLPDLQRLGAMRLNVPAPMLEMMQ